jgi:hypothetical protein
MFVIAVSNEYAKILRLLNDDIVSDVEGDAIGISFSTFQSSNVSFDNPLYLQVSFDVKDPENEIGKVDISIPHHHVLMVIGNIQKGDFRGFSKRMQP